MKINITFDSLEELENFRKPVATSQQRGAESQKVSEPARGSCVGLDNSEESAADIPKAAEDFRVDVRKVLAQLNKKSGKNLASELIKGFGADKLTEVALSDLPALMNKAKEALDAQ